MVINWRLIGCPEDAKPKPMERPGDAERRERAKKKAQQARKKIENTTWEAV